MRTSVDSRIRIQQFQWMPSCTITISELKESIEGNVLLIRSLRLTFSINFCPLLLLTTNYYDIYKPITACTFVAAIQ